MPKQYRSPKFKTRRPSAEPMFEGVVRDLASDGRAVVEHPDGRVFFVAGAWLGERVQVQPTGRKGDVGFGVAQSLLEASTDRRSPPCAHHGIGAGSCGGCPWLFVDYAAQVQAKYQRIERLLARMEQPAAVLSPLIPASAELGYRNRAQLKTDGITLGYMASGSNELVDVQHCLVLTETLQQQLGSLREQLPQRAWRADRRAGIHWHTLDIDDQIPIVRLDARLPFRQGNTEQNDVMRRWLGEVIKALPKDASVLELFAGGGNFTGVLADHFTAVTAVEGDAESITKLQAQFEAGVTARQVNLFDASEVTALVKAVKDTRVLLLDPPRDGLQVRMPLINGLNQLQTVIYVSCDPATWSRDCRDWLAAGFKLSQVTPIDLFPQTPHIELLSVLERH